MSHVKPLEGQTVLVTGAARRLGRAIAVAAADCGAQVALTFLNSGKQARALVDEIERKGVKATALRCDVRDEKSIKQGVNAVLKMFGKIDVLVNNAGTFSQARFEELTAEQWDDTLAINARGPFLMSKYCVPALRKSRGRIINLGSLGGVKPWSTHAHYCASKAALHMLTKVMAKALAPEIAVNCVAPGTIDAGDGSDDLEFLRRFARRTPIGRNGTTKEVAEAVMYFARASHFITGQFLFVDGGLGLD